MTRGSEPGTATSRAQSSGTALKPMLRAAAAGNSASRSLVSVKMQLTASSGRRPLRSRISCINDSVAPRIASASFASTVVAPRSANRRIGAHHASRRAQGSRLARREQPRLPLRQATELQRAERDAPQRQHAMADGLAHPLDLALAPLADRQLEHGRAHLAHLRRRGLAVLEDHALAQALQGTVLHEPALHLGHVGARHLVARVHELVGELSVVGQQDEPGGVGVQPADRVQANACVDELRDDAAPVRVLRSRYHAGRLVDEIDDLLGLQCDRCAVDLDVVGLVHVARRVQDDLAADGDPSLAHDVLRSAPRGDAGVGEELGQAHTCVTIGAAMDLDVLQATLDELGQPRFRARQVWAWAARGASGYEQMTDLPATLRDQLAERVPFSSLELQRDAVSRDGTVKALLRTHDGRAIEAVLMRFADGRRSLCVSSQSGCPLTCTFCATGTMRFGRNLTASEILDQALHFRRIEPVDHCVFMGMGEPMMNLDSVLAACERLPDVGITHRRTTISTVGWVPGIDRLAESDMPIRLAWSVHAPDDALRSQIMPVNDRYPIAEVLAACERWRAAKRRMVFVEYVMLRGVNDGYAQAVALANLLDPRGYKVNLIPYNPTGMYDGSSREAIAAFKAVLEEHGLRATVRLTRGRDIDAACGQLAAKAAAPA